MVGASTGCWTFLLLAVALDRFAAVPPAVILGLYVASYAFGGTFAAVNAARDLRDRHVNIDLLMVTAAAGAAGVGAWAEGAVLLGLFSASNALERFALGRTRRAVRALMDLSPPAATVVRPGAPGGEATVPVEELSLADVVVVRPGERIAVDGVVIDGQTSANQAAVTGESFPVPKRPGDPVFAGTINGEGAVRVRVTKLAHESTLARIVALVEAAQAQKSRAQRFTDAFEGKYALGVIVASAVLAIGPPLLLGQDWGASLYRAMTLLVVASPCALVISTPAATLSALANAARHGVLFKGAGYLEDVGSVEIVAFDKTGTLTEARLRLTDVVVLPGGWRETELLRRAASAEHASEHPLARAVVAEAGARGLPLGEPAAFRALPGRGLVARLDGSGNPSRSGRDGEVAVGNEALLAELGVPLPAVAAAAAARLRDEEKKTVFVADAARVQGVLAFADAVRPDAAGVIAALKALGIRRIVMLTGDHPRIAEAVAHQIGVDEVHGGLLPEQKLTVIGGLRAQGPVAMVGDGINDAPALAAATVGVAMGAAGSDVAIETADVVLMGDDLMRLPYAVALSRRTRQIIRQNLTIALSVIVVLVTAALTIGIPLPLGVVGHEGSTVVVVLNGLRLLRGGGTSSRSAPGR